MNYNALRLRDCTAAFKMRVMAASVGARGSAAAAPLSATQRVGCVCRVISVYESVTVMTL